MMPRRPAIRIDSDKNRLLTCLPKAALNRLLRKARHLRVNSREFLMREGEESDAIYFILKGDFQILKGDKVIDQQTAGGCLGEMGVLTGVPRSVSVRCLTEVEVLRVSARSFKAEAQRQPQLLNAVIRDLSAKLQATQQNRVDRLNEIEKAKRMMDNLVGPEVADTVLTQRSPRQLLRGTIDTAAIVFMDIQGFTLAAETMAPEKLLQSLNQHLRIIIRNVARFNGTIVNFIGDAVLGVFNCPLRMEYPVSAALNCWLSCSEQMESLHRRRRARGQICFEMGAGLNFGRVVAGAIGSQNRFSYSVLGDEVNLTARLEGLTRHYPVNVIVSGAFREQLTPELQIQCVQMDRVQVKGRRTAVDLFTIQPDLASHSKQYEAALSDYLDGEFASAARRYARLPGALPGYMRRRCLDLKRDGRPWPGYFSWTVK